MEFFTVITLQVPVSDGLRIVTLSSVVTLSAGTTRQMLCQQMINRVAKELRISVHNVNVLFFSAEPNQMVSAA
jgi:hypothetical protein